MQCAVARDTVAILGEKEIWLAQSGNPVPSSRQLLTQLLDEELDCRRTLDKRVTGNATTGTRAAGGGEPGDIARGESEGDEGARRLEGVGLAVSHLFSPWEEEC